MVCPTKDGKIVEERDQVLRTCLLPLLFISSTLFSSSGAAKGPFLMLLLMDTFPPYFALRRLTMNLSVRFFVLRVL